MYASVHIHIQFLLTIKMCVSDVFSRVLKILQDYLVAVHYYCNSGRGEDLLNEEISYKKVYKYDCSQTKIKEGFQLTFEGSPAPF